MQEEKIYEKSISQQMKFHQNKWENIDKSAWNRVKRKYITEYHKSVRYNVDGKHEKECLQEK